MAPVTKLDIISGALSLLGQPPIASLASTMPAVLTATRIYDIKRKSKLASHPWRFALRESNLTPLAAQVQRANLSDYQYAYAMPDNPPAVLVWGLANREPFGLFSDQLHTDTNSADLIYIADVDAPGLFSIFAEALMYELAADLAIPISESTTRANYVKDLARETWKIARNRDSQQAWNISIPLHELTSRWPQARAGGSSMSE